MAIIRKIFGPFKNEIEKKSGKPIMRWYFFGIRGDHTTAHWVLTFNPETRKFTANGLVVGQGLGGHTMRKVEQALPNYGTNPIHTGMFLKGDETPVMEGRVVDLLQARLKPEEIAKATALLIVTR